MFKKDKPWYEKGLKFQCSMCGNCCSGPEGEIPVLLRDRRRLAKHVGVSMRTFNQDYTTISKNTKSRVLKMHPTPGKKESLDCIFLDREKIPGKAICSAHLAKPKQCQAWPFWPSILESEKSWKETGIHCCGVDDGELVLSKKEIENKMRKMKGPEKKFGAFERGWK